MNYTFKCSLALFVSLLLHIASSNAAINTLNLDGVTDRILVTNSPELNPAGAITIEAWVRPLTGAGCQTIVGKNFTESYWLGICNQKIRYYTNGVGTSRDGNASIPVGEWTHIAVTYNRLVLQFYINGVLDFEEVLGSPASLPVNLADLGIGGEPTSPCGIFSGFCEFTGNIAEVRLWSAARSRQAIRRDMVRQIDTPTAGLVGVWHLEGSEHDVFGNFTSSLQDRSVISFSGTTAPPVPYGPMRIARLAVSPDLDGNCSAENGALRIPIWHDDDTAVPLVWARVGATISFLYACIEGMPKRITTPLPFAALYLDRGADGGVVAQPEDFRITMHLDDTETSEAGDGVGGFTNTGPLGSFAAANIVGSEFVWSAEFRIPRTILETRGPDFGLQLMHHWHQFVGDDHGWPVDFFWNSPDTWEAAYIDDTVVPAPDSRVPVVSIQHSPEQPRESDSITFTATADDDVGIATIILYVDGVAIFACDYPLPQLPPWTCTYSESLPAGVHRYYAVASDDAGREGRSGHETVQVVVDGDAPVVTTWHTPTDPLVDEDIVLEAAATDLSGIEFIEFLPYGYRCNYPARPTAAFCSFPVTPAAGQRVLRYSVRSVDTDGFEGRAENHYVLFGNTGADTDNDGLSDEIESYLCTSSILLDTDRDGLKDGWEVLGLHLADGDSVDLPALGANPCRRDVFLQYDYEVGARVAPGVIEDVVAAYRRHAITLHVEENERPRPPGSSLSPLRGVVAAYQKDASGNYYFPPKHNWTHYYLYSAHRVGVSGSRERFTTFDIYIDDVNADGDAATNDCDCSPGEPDPAQCGTYVAGAWRNNCIRETPLAQAVRLIHELGHNIGFGHAGRTGTDILVLDGDYFYYSGGWDVGPNYKPNYISSMNYLYFGKTCMAPLTPSDTRPDFVVDVNYSETQLPVLDENALDEAPDSAFALALRSMACPTAASGSVPVIMYTCSDPDEPNTLDIDLTPPAARVKMITDGTRTLARKKHGSGWELTDLPTHPPGIDWNCDGTIQSTAVIENVNGNEGVGLLPPADEICGNGIDDNSNGNIDEGCAWGGGQALTGHSDWAKVPSPFPCLLIYDTDDSCYWHPQTYLDEIGPGAPDCRPAGSPSTFCPDSPVIFPGPEVTIENNKVVDLWPNVELCDGLDNDHDYLVDEGCRDTDADTVTDAIDNCPETGNPYQADRDHSYLGDACESPSPVTKLAVSTSANGLLASWDHSGNDLSGYNVYRLDPGDTTLRFLGAGYPSTSGPFFEDATYQSGEYSYFVYPVSLNGAEGPGTFISNSTDTDGDGLLDTYEIYIGTDSKLVDTDGDGLADGAGGLIPVGAINGGVDTDQDGFVDGEQDFGTSPIQLDTDGDGFSDGDEADNGTNPLSDTSFPVIADGDLTGDGVVNVADVLVGLNILFGNKQLTPVLLSHGDVAPMANGVSISNGLFNLGDLFIIQRIAIGF